MQCLLLFSKNTHWISLNDSNTGLLPWQQAKNKGADQLRGYRKADLRLCFRICKKQLFSRCGSYMDGQLLNPAGDSLLVLNTHSFFSNKHFAHLESAEEPVKFVQLVSRLGLSSCIRHTRAASDW